MKVCFVGIGSIAKRHISNLRKICTEKNIPLVIDAFRRTNNQEDTLSGLIDNVYISGEKLPTDYDVIFLTNPTEYHADMLCSLHDNGKHFFIEKPVSSMNTIKKILSIHLRKDSIYYVACPLRYTKVIQYLKASLDVSTVNSVRCISSSYLPDWRPGTDYRNNYSAQRKLGGGVNLDLIHEWDYMVYLFGFPTEVKSFIGKVSNLEIDSDDYAIYIAKYNNMISELHLDYFGRRDIRNIDIFTDDETISGDLINGTVKYLVEGKTIELKEKRDEYQIKELCHFIDEIQGKAEPQNNVMDAIKVLKLTNGIAN